MKQTKNTKKKTVKMKISDIKKSADAQVSQAINKIKSDEKKIVMAMSMVFLCIFGIMCIIMIGM